MHIGHIVLKDKRPKYPEYMWCSCCRDVTPTRMQDEGFDDPFGGASCWEEVCDQCGEYRSAADTEVRTLYIRHKEWGRFWLADRGWVGFPEDATEYDAHSYTTAWTKLPDDGEWVTEGEIE